ncbi:MAG: VWA domain-containing protein [Armatimonadetes bacterium]|mgnify:CR=1 FL=1|jgi:hypothetical protein|nr:VWA domain-containing protein [Armatimonadota bacterium]GIV12954.1 MAG: VWA domain-containing protein [Fimbriimonadales bacterium]CUU04908.1 VWA domain containing CoxE-like protein [Armatimonadetes bacterium GBS]CUU34722.1 VWA domain containing CoxE-like protein [Armatimonadetes bacterium GXS]CUU35217.1 VWA domain containing CoxE-like protein [Armatimonadetes bacterium DC]
MHDRDESLTRWRLILGRTAEQQSPHFRLRPDAFQEMLPTGVGPQDLDHALEFVYDSARTGGTGDPTPYIPQWLEQIRTLFDADTLVMIQKDAFERRGLTQMLLQPELLQRLEPNIHLVSTLLALRDQMPDEVKQTAREIIRSVVEEFRKKLENQVRQSVIGALQRNRHSPLRTARNIDWRTTVRKNLKHYLPEHKTIVPERVYFWANEKRFRDWQVIVLVDQSGSMANSAVHASLMAALFASLKVLDTRLVLFSTEVVDVSDYLNEDPVELLFNLQLGGGTDIAQAVAYGTTLIRQPEKCLFILITDLYEGGNPEALLQRLRFLKESKVHVLCLLALEEGKPAYDRTLARQVAALDIPTFASTPRKLLQVMETILKGANP